MELLEYISNDNIVIESEYTVQETLSIFNEFSYTHLPVLQNTMFIGSIAKEDLIFEENIHKKIQELRHLLNNHFVTENDLMLDLIPTFSTATTNILPVIKDQNTYVGYIDLNDVITYFANTPFLNNEGVIVILEKKSTNFSIAEVCQIIETNGNSLMGCYVNKQQNQKTQITLRLNPIKINELIQLFRSYKYKIINELLEDSYLEDLKKRSEYFLKYLNI